jgi:antitoxin (DNA-binding transcriptional repressor) of toxin-antitoxin stability system
MSNISIVDIQRDPAGFIGRVEAGETMLVLRGESPLAEVRPIDKAVVLPRPFGLCAGRFEVPSGFDQPLPDSVLKEFEGA